MWDFTITSLTESYVYEHGEVIQYVVENHLH